MDGLAEYELFISSFTQTHKLIHAIHSDLDQVEKTASLTPSHRALFETLQSRLQTVLILPVKVEVPEKKCLFCHEGEYSGRSLLPECECTTCLGCLPEGVNPRYCCSGCGVSSTILHPCGTCHVLKCVRCSVTCSDCNGASCRKHNTVCTLVFNCRRNLCKNCIIKVGNDCECIGCIRCSGNIQIGAEKPAQHQRQFCGICHRNFCVATEISLITNGKIYCQNCLSSLEPSAAKEKIVKWRLNYLTYWDY